MKTIDLHCHINKFFLLALCFIFFMQNIMAGDGTAKLTVTISPTGGGTVYIDDIQTQESSSKKKDNSNSENATFQLEAKASTGYLFNRWELPNNTTNINAKVSVALKVGSNVLDENKYTATAYFQRIGIELGTATWSPNTNITWKTPTVTGKITVPVNYAIATTDFTDDGFGLSQPMFSKPTIEWSGTKGGEGTVTVQTTYTLPPNGNHKVKFTLNAAPGANDPEPGPTSREEKEIEIPVDLTPRFTIISSREFSTALGKYTSATISPSDFGSLPIANCTWQATITGTGYEHFSLNDAAPASGNCKITYIPKSLGEHTATLTLTATFTDIHGVPWTHSETCTLIGKCIEDREPELYIEKSGITQTTARYEFATAGSQTSTFNIASLGVEDITASSSNASFVQPSISADGKTLTLVVNSRSSEGTQNVTVTVSGKATMGANVGSSISTTLSVTIYRWFNNMTVKATPDATSMIIEWTSAGPQVTSYQILRGSTILATVDQNTLSYTDTGLTADKSYTYTIKAIASGSTCSVSVTKSTSVASSYLTLANCPEMLVITGVDASVTFDSEGKVLMDKLYIMNKKNNTRCHIYDKYNDTSYKLIATVNPTVAAGRAGRIENKKIYIGGTCESLFWNTGDYLGWMQPVNCDIYLDNVRLRTAYSTASKTIFNETINLKESDNSGTVQFSIKNQYDASIFYIPEGITYIHTKGDNYLGGNLGHRLYVKLTVHVDATITSFDRYLENYMANYSAPITLKGAYLFDDDTQPDITCIFDSEWADGENKNGYLDLSTRTCQHQDSSTVTNDYIINDLGEDARIRWTYHKGYRYASPLKTGGPNGTFIINGGNINLWPANGHAANVEVNNKVGAGTAGGVFAMNLSIIGGQLANYLACGNSKWDLLCDENIFNFTNKSQLQAASDKTQESSDATIIKEIKKFSPAPTAILYGQGSGIPEGHLIINGGTISANTDPNSFAYNWTDFVGGKSINKTAQNVADDGSGQPLFGPNVVINGGTFRHPLYGTADHGTGSALNKEEYTREGLNPISQWQKNGINDYDVNNYRAKNLHGDEVYREDYALPQANIDYTEFNEIDITDDSNAHAPNEKRAVIGSAGTNEEYLYGMTNVWSDGNGLGYFYLPKDNSGIMQNYFITSTNQLTAFTQTKQGDITTTYQPYHLWVDKGGEITVENDYRVYGRPYYRSTFNADEFQALTMPFTAERFFVTDTEDEQFKFYSYVEVDDANKAGVSEADRIDINNNAYCYAYFLDDSQEKAYLGKGNQSTTGLDDAFKRNYHTHPNGSTLLQGKTYVIKFPKWDGYDNNLVEGKGYWERNIVTLEGTKGQTIKGSGKFEFADRPDNSDNDVKEPTFIMDGNDTFDPQNISDKGEVYIVDYSTYGDNSFHATTLNTLAPMQGYLIGSEKTMKHYRIIGREGKVEQTALEQLIQTGWTAVGVHQAIMIMTPEDATAQIFTADGRLWKTITLTANTPLYVDAPTGFYVVRAGIGSGSAKKVLVE